MRAVLALVLLAFCVCVSSQGIGDNKTVSQKNNGAEQPKAPAKVDTSSLEKAIRESIKEASEKPDPNADEKLQIDRQVKIYTGQLSAYTEKLSDYTRWLVLATVILGVIGIGQGYLTWRSVRVAEQALTDLERPYLFIDLSEPATKQRVVPFDYHLRNTGRTAAILTHSHHEVVITGSDDTFPEPIDPYREIPQDKLPNGVAIDTVRKCTVHSAPDIDYSPKAIYLIGFVRYRDIFKKGHVTGFCAKLDWRTETFLLKGDDRYNYTSDEGKEPAS